MLTISLPNYGCLAKPVLSSILEIPFCNRPSGSRPYIISCMLYNIQYLFHCGHFKNIASRGNDFLYRISFTSVEVYCLFMFSEELKSYLLQLYDYYIIYSRYSNVQVWYESENLSCSRFGFSSQNLASILGSYFENNYFKL